MDCQATVVKGLPKNNQKGPLQLLLDLTFNNGKLLHVVPPVTRPILAKPEDLAAKMGLFAFGRGAEKAGRKGIRSVIRTKKFNKGYNLHCQELSQVQQL